MKAKKSYGQHFLKEEAIAERIACALELSQDYPNILEVGPGMGMLTKYLMKHYPQHRLLAIEADRDMYDYLQNHLVRPPLEVLAGDFLRLNLPEVFHKQDFALIGNYPYNISSQIIFKQLENRQWIPEMVGMFQKEVAERVVAQPDTSAYGILSVLTQAYYDTKYLFTVKAGSFNPPPKVQSAVIRLSRKPNCEDLGCEEVWLRRVVKTAFGQRRKMLRNTLKPFLKKEILFDEKFFERRPETLNLTEFVALTRRIELAESKSEAPKSEELGD